MAIGFHCLASSQFGVLRTRLNAMIGRKPGGSNKAEAERLGFVACGFRARRCRRRGAARSSGWIEAGHHGDDGLDGGPRRQRGRRTALWPDAKSVIALAMSYAPRPPIRWRWRPHPDRGRISVYAQGGDYHKTVKKALKALGRWLHRRPGAGGAEGVRRHRAGDGEAAGAAAGIGWQGKHTNLVSREHGSWLFLGVIYTSLELEPDAPAARRALRQLHALPRRLPDGAFPARTGSMRGAASPT